MSSTKEVYLTEEGLEELKKELEDLKLVKRPEVIQSLKDARALGDLSENAEYDAARNEQAIVEARISELEQMVEKAILIKNASKDIVSLGAKVTIEYEDEGDQEVYHIVGSKESDPFLNKISNESPIAQAILDRRVGDIVSVSSPNGVYEVKIVKIA